MSFLRPEGALLLEVATLPPLNAQSTKTCTRPTSHPTALPQGQAARVCDVRGDSRLVGGQAWLPRERGSSTDDSEKLDRAGNEEAASPMCSPGELEAASHRSQRGSA